MRPERRQGPETTRRLESERTQAVWFGSRIASAAFWRQSDKSREREGSALATKEASLPKPNRPNSACSRRGLGAPAPGAALEHMTVMQQSVEHRANSSDIAKQFAPVLHRPI